MNFAHRGSLEEGLEAVMRVAGAALKTLHVIDCGNLLTDRSVCLLSLAKSYFKNVVSVSVIALKIISYL